MTKAAPAFEKARSWIIDSGIQDMDFGNPNFYGCFCDWFDPRTAKYNAAYPEITGYGIRTLMFFNHLKKDRALIKKAEVAAEWLMAHATYKAKTGSGIVGKIWRHSSERDRKAYTFDTGMCLAGLCSLYQARNDEKILEFATSLANWLVSNSNADGSIRSHYHFDSSAKDKENGTKWSYQSGPFHDKVGIGLYELWKIKGDARYYEAALNLCEYAITRQEPDGRFITDQNDSSTYTHAHCYSVEGLLYIGTKEKNKKMLEAAFRGAAWLANAQLESGGLPRKFISNDFIKDEGADITAQALRIWLICSQLEGTGKFKANIQKATDRLLSRFQISDMDLRMDGGFYYGDFDGLFVKNVNSWAGCFAVQALWLAAGNPIEKCIDFLA